MKHFVFAMDTCFWNSIVGGYPYDIRCEMLTELGFDGIYVSLSPQELQNAPRMAVTEREYGLKVTAAYGGVDIAMDNDSPQMQQTIHLYNQLPDGCDLEISVSCGNATMAKSSADGDDRAIEKLSLLLKIAEKHDSYVCLYPHFGAWLERIEDGVRLCQKMNQPRLKVVFCGFHWYAVDGKELAQRITDAMPYLHSVNMCGTRKGGNVAGCTIEPIDAGEMDNFALLGLLDKIGYKGRIGFQGYSIGGDVYNNLRRSISVFREMEERLEKHPNWGWRTVSVKLCKFVKNSFLTN
jgi:sugar phosphate isomerase/epimerase